MQIVKLTGTIIKYLFYPNGILTLQGVKTVEIKKEILRKIAVPVYKVGVRVRCRTAM